MNTAQDIQNLVRKYGDDANIFDLVTEYAENKCIKIIKHLYPDISEMNIKYILKQIKFE